MKLSSLSLVKYALAAVLTLLFGTAYSQYPATGNKQRLGWQTTGDGLVYRGAIADTSTLDPSGLNNAWMLLDTVNGSLYAYRSKAWQLVSGGGGVSMPFDSVTFNINEGDASEQELKYSAEKGYLQYGGLDSVQIPLLPGIWYVRNDDSVTVSKGMVVRASGTLGASGRIKVKRMIADGSIPAMYVLGIAMHDIASGADGYVMTQGKIRQLNTEAYSEGAVLYADVDTLGGLTQTEPTGSNLKLPIAFVVYSASNGTLAVRVSPGTYLRDLHDAYITSPASNASLYYNTSEGIWRDTTAAVLVADTTAMLSSYISNADTATMLSSYISNADTAVFARDFQISGTANYLAKFTGSNAVGNSVLFDNGTNISLGSTNPISNGANSRWLTLYGSTGYSGGIVYSVADTALAYHYLNADAAGKHLRHYANSGYGQTFFTNGSGTARMTISAAGDVTIPNAAYMATNSASNVGIGTESTTYKLDLNDQRQGGGITGMRISTYYYPGILFQSALRSNNGKVILNDFANGYGTGSLQSAMILQSPGAVQFSTGGDNIRTTIDASGNVGIATSSPSRPLHVNSNISMIIPSGATGTRPASGANGDIRYNTDNANFEWYSGTGWREAVNAARSPTAGLANRFSKFDANGLLDTSAILIQANNRIGIFNSPAAGDSALTVTGGIMATRDMYARRLNVSTFTGQVLSINNYAPTGSLGGNVYIGTTGLTNTYTSGLDGALNTSLGSDALNANTTGYGNTAVGRNTLSKNTIGVQNTAVGLSSLTDNTIGILNTGVGGGTLVRNTTGNSNTAVGASSLSFTTSGGSNTGVGQSTLTNNTTGSNNTAVGLNALDNLTTASDNTAVGYLAGSYAGSGTTANQTSSNSTYVGYQARAGASGNTAEVVIGSNAVGNGSNTVTIGGSATTGTYFQYGETYIGTAVDSGAYTLQVNGNTKLIGNLARKKPVTIADTTYTVLSDDSWLICNHTAQIKITLPTAANSIGRELMIKYVNGGGATVISNATNVSPIVGGALTNIILFATAGSWVTLVCDGANWIIMQKG